LKFVNTLEEGTAVKVCAS